MEQVAAEARAREPSCSCDFDGVATLADLLDRQDCCSRPGGHRRYICPAWDKVRRYLEGRTKAKARLAKLGVEIDPEVDQ